MLSFKDFLSEELLLEKLIVFNGGKQYGQVVFMSGGAACYPEGTEYFNGRGWVSIENYKEGDNVLQYDKNTGVASLIKPTEYNVLLKDQFYNIKNRRVDFTTSKGHKHLLVSEKTGLLVDKTMEDMFETHNNTNRGNRYKLLTNFTYDGFGIDKSDDEIRLCVALFADGHKLNQENKYRVGFKKERKIVRFRELLNLNNIEYREYLENDYTKFEFYHNQWDKKFEDYWYSCSYEQLKVICSEVILWDGSVVDCNKRGRMPAVSFSTTSEKSKDFIQFAFSATGHDVNVHKDTREGRITCYGVYVTNSKGVGISKNLRAETTTEIREVSGSDKMYCFTVPTGYFVVRQNDKIFVSGNSGKGFSITKFLDSRNFKVRDVDEWKKTFQKIDAVKGKYPEIRNLNLKDPDDVASLHGFVDKLKVKDKTLNLLLKDLPNKKDKTTYPNILFDITGKDIKSITKVLPLLYAAGYEKRNVHLIWALTNFDVAMKRNKERDRVVPDLIMKDTHSGAAKTMTDILFGRVNLDIDGQISVILNNQKETKIYPDDLDSEGKPISREFGVMKGKAFRLDTRKGVKTFNYIRVKREGKAPMKKQEILDQILRWVRENVPKNDETSYLWD